MRIVKLAFALLMIATLASAQAAPAKPNKAAAPAAKASKRIPVFDPTALDKSVDPCADFFRYSCGGWMAANPIPSDQSRWGRFDDLQERNRDILHDILERAA